MAAAYETMLQAAIEEARIGLSEGGIPIGAAIFRPDGSLVSRGHNKRIQDNDPCIHGETDAFRNAGRQPGGYKDLIMVTTLAPCWYCTGLLRQFNFRTVVVGESRTFSGGVSSLRSLGVNVIDLDSKVCFDMMEKFIAEKPEIWYEDIGLPAEPASTPASPPKKVALVTGAGSGIGEAVAIAFVNAGFVTVLTGRRKDQLDRVVSTIGENAYAIPCDISLPDSVNALFSEVKSRFGRLDVLFNNAGVGAPAVPIEDLPFEDWKRVIDTNVTGVFLCTQAAVRIMKDQQPRGGRIINNGSISATMPRPNSAPYTASKHAVSGLTKATSLDGRKYDIACGQIDIGNALTPLTEGRMPKGVLQADLSIKAEPTIDVKHVAESVLLMAQMPLDANVQTMTVMATKMPFVGRG